MDYVYYMFLTVKFTPRNLRLMNRYGYIISIVLVALALLLVKATMVLEDIEGDADLERQKRLGVEEQNQLCFANNEALRQELGSLQESLVEQKAFLQACITKLDEEEWVSNSPKNRLGFSSLRFSQDGVMINVDEVVPGIVADTNSMAPLLDADNIVLEVKPDSPEEISLGDIIIYEHANSRIIHRVVRISQDEDGWYAIAKGDNNPHVDPLRIRFDQIRGVVVGIIY